MWFLWVQESIKAKCEMIILHIIKGLNDGGAEAVLYKLVNACREQHHSVVWLIGIDHYDSTLEKFGTPTICINMSVRLLLSVCAPLGMYYNKITLDCLVLDVSCWFFGGVLAKLAGVHPESITY